MTTRSVHKSGRHRLWLTRLRKHTRHRAPSNESSCDPTSDGATTAARGGRTSRGRAERGDPGRHRQATMWHFNQLHRDTERCISAESRAADRSVVSADPRSRWLHAGAAAGRREGREVGREERERPAR